METQEAVPEQEIDNYTRVKHLANIGDIIAVMPAIKSFWEITGKQVVFCQRINTPAAYYPGATHPTVDSSGVNVCVNDKMFEMIKPLIEAQPYIKRMEKYDGQKIDLDFDVIREKTFVNLPNGMIQSWIFFAYPDLARDLSKPWIELPEQSHPVQEQTKGKIILNFTERYRNHIIDYFFLRKFAPYLIFSGTEAEHFKFCHQWQLNIPRLEVNDFLELAYAYKACRFMMGNQSAGWNLAESMHVPRILEVCRYATNCMPFVGEDSYGYYHQVAAEYYFRKLDMEK